MVGMDITSTLRAIQRLGSETADRALDAGVLMRLERLCLALFIAIGQLVARCNDPRLVLAHAQLVEAFAQQVHHQQLSVAVLSETTGAHSLSMDTYDALREPDYDFPGEPQRSAGRTCYLDAADLLSHWLGINYHELKRRIADAHLLIARRGPEGSLTTPRFTRLAELYASGAADRRTVARVARQLEKLEPVDTVFDGVPLPPTATAADGRLLEDHAATALTQLGPKQAAKQISAILKDYKVGTPAPLPLGLFLGRERADGSQEFLMRTQGADTDMLLSVMNHADDRRTQAGKSARLSEAERHSRTADPEASQDELPGVRDAGSAQSSVQDPLWLTSQDPMPLWAQDPEADDRAEPAEPQESPEQCGPSVAQRRLNALMDILAAPASGGAITPVRPKIVVYMWLKELEDLANAHAVTANGVRLPAGELRRLLAASKIIPVVLGGNSQPLDVGRANRFHQGSIRTAILARDRGCILPECSTPPNQVEIDHYRRPWSEGGETSVDNGVGLCQGGHHQRHAGQIQIVDVNGLPHVILPKHLDPEQKPRRNTYWGALQLGDAERAAAECCAPSEPNPAKRSTGSTDQESPPGAAGE